MIGWFGQFRGQLGTLLRLISELLPDVALPVVRELMNQLLQTYGTVPSKVPPGGGMSAAEMMANSGNTSGNTGGGASQNFTGTGGGVLKPRSHTGS